MGLWKEQDSGFRGQNEKHLLSADRMPPTATAYCIRGRWDDEGSWRAWQLGQDVSRQRKKKSMIFEK